MKAEYLPVQYMKKLREKMRLYFVSSIFIGVLLSIFASSFVSIFRIKQNEIFIVTGIMLACVVMWYLYRYNSELSMRRKIHGTIFYSSKKNELIYVPRYRFATCLKENITALFAECQDDKKMWKKQKLCFFSNDKQADDNFNALLIKENIEYYVLEILSTTLTDFYNKKTSRKLHIYCRNDIPDILIGNRFLATFSKDVNQRSSFVSTAKKVKEKEQGVLVMAFGCNGEKYDRFDLTLPIKSKIRRTGETVVVETPTLRLDITLNCEGYSDVWPAGFEKYYLNNEFFETFAYRVDITVDVRFKFWKSFFNKNTETHQWVDKFITRLYDSTDISEFYRRINWEGNLFVLSKLLSKSKV